MAEAVKRRRYHSPQRAKQAAATRRAILDAARELFEQRGYPATTMEAIAGAAEVSLKTVYLAFSTKSGVLRAVWDVLLKGDLETAPVAERPWYLELFEERDPKRQLRLVATNSRIVKTRIGPLLRVIRDAAPVDADAGALWNLIQDDFYDNQRVIVESLAGKKALRPNLDVARATDILWTLNHPDNWLLLVGRRFWQPEEWEHWFTEVAISQLLRPQASSPRT
jgi:AcrR family transcriptional regulator